MGDWGKGRTRTLFRLLQEYGFGGWDEPLKAGGYPKSLRDSVVGGGGWGGEAASQCQVSVLA